MSNQAVAPETPLKVLVVDDAAANRRIVSVFLKKMGHEVVLAENGAQAVDTFQAEQPDLVLMDVMMPVMDGFDATRRIKALCGDRWVPVVFLSALDKDENLVVGLDAGGDDYLSKPVNFVVLQAKLRSLGRAIEGQRRLVEAHLGRKEDERRLKDAFARLQAYHDHQEVENALAADILSRQLTRKGLADPVLASWVAPAAKVSGDVIAAARAPDGELFVMLADATGHGLAASISTLPLLTLFYEMVDWGMALSAIVARINDQLCQALPPSRFVAAAFLAINEQRHRAEVWVGGLPPVLLLDPDGTVTRVLDSNRVPLGIVDSDGEMSVVESVDLAPGSQFALFSDGLIEAANAAGEPFGMERLLTTLIDAPAERRIAAVQTALGLHLGEAEPHDDVALLLVACRPS
ncbi:MAG: fused response regulator/phosphatase [Sulfurisoma sp.]|nr:fused response regulator/phosphatase [Sulfurisoma sp.]